MMPFGSNTCNWGFVGVKPFLGKNQIMDVLKKVYCIFVYLVEMLLSWCSKYQTHPYYWISKWINLSIWHHYDLLDLLHKEDSRVGLGEVDEVSLLEPKAVLGGYAAPVCGKAFQATIQCIVNTYICVLFWKGTDSAFAWFVTKAAEPESLKVWKSLKVRKSRI